MRAIAKTAIIRVLCSLITCSSLIYYSSPAKAVSMNTAQQNYVLVLNSYNESSPWSNSMTTPIMHMLSDIDSLDAYIEHLNFFMMKDTSMIKKFPILIKEKYGTLPPRALVIVGNTSMILCKEIKKLWGDIPIILCGMDQYIYDKDFYASSADSIRKKRILASQLVGEYNLTMLYTPTFLKENIELMKIMIPGMKKLMYLDDGIYPSQLNDLDLRHIIKKDFPELSYQYISAKKYTLHQLYDSMRVTDNKTGILFATWFTESFSSDQSLINAYRSIASISQPLFTIRYAGMDDGGMVGGYMYNDKEFTAQLLSTLKQVLEGKQARDIPFYTPSGGAPTFNYTMLVHKGLDPKLCPPGTIFYDKPADFFDKYKWVMLTILTIFILLVIIQQTRIRMLRALRKAQQKELKSHAQYTELINNMPIHYIKAKIEYDANGNIKDAILLDINKYFEKNFHPRKDIIGKRGSEIFPESISEFVHFINTALKKKGPITFPYYFKSKDTFFDIVLTQAHESDTINIFCLDSTKLHHAQQQLSSTNQKLSMALEVANITPWKWDLKTHTILCDINRPIRLSAISEENNEPAMSVPESQYFAKIVKEDRPRVMQAFHKLTTGVISKIQEEYRVINIDPHGRHIDWIEVKAMVESRDAKGHPVTLVGSSLVITDRKNLEKELMTAINRAEESNRLKSAFLANMSHEIRTPLNAIIGFSNILALTDQKEEKEEYIQIIESNNTLLLQLISDILDLSKIEAGTLEFVYSDVELNDIIKETESALQYRIKSPSVQLLTHMPVSSCRIHTERNRLMQLLNNLLNNACKFTAQGSITFGYEIRGNMLYFDVRDTGCGIPADKIDSIFGRFVKLDSFIQGTGLGLSICQTIVKHMGGEIGVYSEESKGSTFWFTIPYQPAKSANKK